MNCPKCGGNSRVSKRVKSIDNIAFYRRHTCISCDHTFYTTEYEIPSTDAIKALFKSDEEAAKKRHKRRTVKVRCVDFDKVFDSMTEAAEYAGVSKAAICACCQGRHGTAGYLKWEYYKEEET